MKHELSKEKIAEALESMVWPNMAIGNKAIIKLAIDVLRKESSLLAAHEQEPYGYVHKAIYETVGSCGLSSDHEAYRDTNGDHIPLYTRPAPVMECEQEPVAWRYRFVHTPKSLEHGSPFTTDWVMTHSEDDCNPSDCFERQPLYTHPAPSIPAAVPDVCDGLEQEAFEEWASGEHMDMTTHPLHWLFLDEKTSAARQAWKGAIEYCRAAMLQAEPQNAPQNIPENIPTLRDALSAIRNLGPIDAEKIHAERDALNTLDLPHGWVMVPIELLSELRDFAHPEIEKYCEMWAGRRDSEFPAMRKIITDADDLLAAAPKSSDFRENANSSTELFREIGETSTKCWCRTCRPVNLSDMRFVVCPDCGNKRCPKANDHRNACSGSNEPGQEGSAYPVSPKGV